MQKAKEYDWKDSNMALFGSDTEKKVRALTKKYVVLILDSLITTRGNLTITC